MNNLPPTWAHVAFSSITTDASQRIPSADEQITYIDIGSVDRNSKTIVAPQRLLGADAPSRARKQVRSGDTLVSMTRPNLNAVALVPSELDGQIASTGFDVLRPIEGIDPRWIAYLVRTEAFVQAMSEVVQGALYPAVRSKDVRSYQVPLAPSAEQTRIADQLDKLLARIRACNDRLDAIPALLKRFRQAVLAAMTGGRLTENWREENESSEWIPSKLAACGAVSGGLTKNANRQALTLVRPYLRVANVYANRLELSDVTDIGLTESEYSRTRLRSGDLLIVEGNGSLEQLGRVALWSDELDDCVHQNHLIRWRTSGPLPKFVLYWLLSPRGRTDLMNLASTTTGLHTLSISKVGAVPIALPSTDEQAEIVRQVEALFTLADRIEARYTAARAQAQRLTPLLLAKAFRGELVQQDPQDEPASVLLERIAAATPAKARTSRGRPRIQPKRQPAIPELDPTDWASLPDGAWAAPADPEGDAAMVWVTAALRAWGEPVPEREARLAALLCQQPRLFTAVLPTAEAMQWSRLVGDEARPLPAQVLSFQPAINSHWGRAIKGMRARGDLVESGPGEGITWALGPGAAGIETTGWPDGRAGFVVAYLCAHGIASVLPMLETAAQEFVDARAA